jgi:hypothetical protein
MLELHLGEAEETHNTLLTGRTKGKRHYIILLCRFQMIQQAFGSYLFLKSFFSKVMLALSRLSQQACQPGLLMWHANPMVMCSAESMMVRTLQDL